MSDSFGSLTPLREAVRKHAQFAGIKEIQSRLVVYTRLLDGEINAVAVLPYDATRLIVPSVYWSGITSGDFMSRVMRNSSNARDGAFVIRANELASQIFAIWQADSEAQQKRSLLLRAIHDCVDCEVFLDNTEYRQLLEFEAQGRQQSFEVRPAKVGRPSNDWKQVLVNAAVLLLRDAETPPKEVRNLTWYATQAWEMLDPKERLSAPKPQAIAETISLIRRSAATTD